MDNNNSKQTDMKTTFCKVIELEDCQVLIKKEPTTEDGKREVSVTVDFDGNQSKIKYGYETEEQKDEAFVTICNTPMREVVDDLKRMLGID